MSMHIASAPASPLVDERVPRVVAAATVVVAATVLVTGWWVVLVALAADFLVRAGGRPDWSALARLARAQVVPRLQAPPRAVAARPKQFAAGMGALISTVAAVAALMFSAVGVATALLMALVAAAFLEAAFGFCVGCRVYALLSAAGVVADDCVECADISQRSAARD